VKMKWVKIFYQSPFEHFVTRLPNRDQINRMEIESDTTTSEPRSISKIHGLRMREVC